MAQDPRISVTLLGEVGLWWSDYGVASSYEAASTSSDFSRRNRNPNLYMKSPDLLISPIDSIIGKTLFRRNKIYLTLRQSTGHLFVNFTSNSGLSDICFGYCLVSTPSFQHLPGCHLLPGVILHWNICQVNLDLQVPDTESRQDSLWLLSFCITAFSLKCFCQMLVLWRSDLFW